MAATSVLANTGARGPAVSRGARGLLACGVLLAFVCNAIGLLELPPDADRVLASLRAMAPTPEFLTLAVVGALLAAALPRLRPIGASLLVMAAIVPVTWVGLGATAPRPLLPMEYSLLTLLVMFAVDVLAAYFLETQQRQRLLEAFGHFAPPEVVDSINRANGGVSLEVEAREISVMFCDIRNFSSLSEDMEPRHVAELLTRVFTPLTAIVHRYGGIIDKYLGDGVMALWGAPLANPLHAGNALLAAFEIQEALAELRPRLEAEGWPAIHMGIGINTGLASVGNMGSLYRMSYTAVGDTVNLAARLQELTRVFDTRIVVGQGTRNAFPGVTYRELGLVQVRGKQALVHIYEPCNPKTDPESTVVANMHRHNEALAHYCAREWDAAAQAFEQLQAGQPDDPLYRYYLERIAGFRDDPPPEGWRGELRFSVK